MPDDLATREFLKTASAPRISTKKGMPSGDVDGDSDAEDDAVSDEDEEEKDIFDMPKEVVEKVDMSLDNINLPARPRKAAGKAKAKAKAKGKAKAKAEDLVVVPAGLSLEDCEKQRTRNGFRLMWSGNCIAVQSHWGRGLENVSMKCNMHHKCRVAIGILRLTDTDLLVRWVLAGAGPRFAASEAHTGIPLPELSSSSSSSSSARVTS